MKRFSIPALVLTTALIVSGCGAGSAQMTPTAGAVDLQSTIAAVAFTKIAQTQAAVPTATPRPPTATSTDTPAPTGTLLSLPPSGVPPTLVAGGNSGGGDPCLQRVLPASLQGKPVKIRINNSTKAALAVSVYLNQTGPQGECGYRSYSLDPGQFVVINDLVEGCYTLWAWNPDPEDYFIVTNGTTCMDSASTWVFDISTGSIRVRT